MEDRGRSTDWTKPVGIPDEHPKVRKNVTQGCFYRELGRYKNNVPSEFLWAAEDKLVDKNTYEELICQLPDSPRSTFLMVFSPDGKKVASTHGNHNVYVTDLTTGKNIQTLSGHPRTPWCIAFHPSSSQILASGCLAGQVRVWDLHGGSEVWAADSQTVIASLAFHPVYKMLVIATYNELHFWDWSQSKPFAKCSTKSRKEKVRYVSFDRLGNKLITGIANPVNTASQRDRVSVVSSQPTVTTSATTSTAVPSTTVTTTSWSLNLGRSFAYCDSFLMNQYNQLVRRYIDLSRSRITRTVDRGTDPMDLVDVQNQSESSTTGSISSTSQANLNRSVRYRILRSACRSYRPPSSRERFRIHSSLLSGLPSRSSSSSNSLVRTTTTTTTTSQSIIFTTIAASSSSSTMPSQLFRLRQCGLSYISRPVCLTFSRDNSSNLFSVRSSQTTSGAVTNPTYTSYSERSIFSTRETNSGETERSRIPLTRPPYRLIFDDISHIRASVHTLIRPSSEESGNRSGEQRMNVISPLERRDRLRSHLLDVEEVEIDRDLQRSFTYVSPFRRLSSDSESTSTTPTNTQRPSPQQWVSHNSNHLPLHPRPVPRFQVRPSYDLNNTSPVRRYREDTDSESSTNTTPIFEASSSEPNTSLAMSPVQLNAGPVPRLQIRPRYLQDQHSPLELITNPEAQSSSSQSNLNLRRQFVLSRHSNSPFQPRVPHRIENPAMGNVTATTSSGSGSSRPEIPSCMSSFVASGMSGTTRSTPSVSLPVGNVASSTSKATNTATTTIAGDDSFVRWTREIRNRFHFFDHVQVLLRDRIRNSSENSSTDSTVNYSNIANESEGEARNVIDSSLEDGNASNGLGPRGLDPMLSSVSDNADSTNDVSFFPNTSAAGPASNGESIDHDASNLEFAVPWDSDTVPFPPNPSGAEETSRPQRQSQEPFSASGTSSYDKNKLLSLKQKIDSMNLRLKHIKRFCREVQSNRMEPIEENEGPNSSRDSVNNPNVNNMERLAINDNPPETSSAQSSNENFYSHFKEVVKSMINALLEDDAKNQRGSTSQLMPETSQSSQQRSETEEPQPGPSGLSGNSLPNTDLKVRIYKSLRDILNKTSKRKSVSSGNTSQRCAPRIRFRRHGRHSLDSTLPRVSARDFCSSMESTIQNLESKANDLWALARQQRTSRACQSCGQKKRPSKDLPKQKRPCSDTGPGQERGGSSSKIMKNSAGGRSVASTSTDPGPASPDANSTSELLRRMIERMETTARFQPEALRRTKELTGNAHSRRLQTTVNSSDDSDSDDTSGQQSVYMRNVHTNRTYKRKDVNKNLIYKRKCIVNMNRTVTQLRARRLLDYMVRNLTEFFEEHSDNSDNVLDDQILSLYTLLHLALELTDLLLDQLDATSHDFERAWGMNNSPSNQSEPRNTEWLFSDRSRVIRRLRERHRGLTRSSIHPSFGPNREDTRRIFPNPFFRTIARTRLYPNQHPNRSGLNNATNTVFCRYRPSAALFPGYRRSRRAPPRMSSSSIPSGWCNIDESSRRFSSLPRTRHVLTDITSPSRITNGDSANNRLRGFRTWERRNSMEEETERSRNMRSDNNDINANNGNGSNNNSNNDNNNNGSDSSNSNHNNNNNSNNCDDNDNNNNGNNGSNYNSHNNNNNNNINNNNTNTNNSNHNNNDNNNNINNINSNNNNNTTTTINNNSNNNNNNDNNYYRNSHDDNNNSNTNAAVSSNSNDSSNSNNNAVISGNSQSSNTLPFSTYLNLREQRPMYWIRYGSNNEPNSSTGSESQPRESNFTVPVVHVNDIPVADVSMLNQPRYRPLSPTPRIQEDLWRWRTWRPRFLHPRNSGVEALYDEYVSNLMESVNNFRMLSASMISNSMNGVDPVIITDTPTSPHHRIQAWDFSKMKIPDISDREANGVVAECKIHNDASVDVSNDGHLLVTLLPSGRFSVTTMLGVYSLDWSSLGQLLYKTSFEQNAVSVSLSPTNRHLLVGLASRPFVLRDRVNMAQIFRLEGARPSPPGGTWQSGRGRLVHVRDLEQTRDTNIMSLNCIRWAPGAGQGLVYGTNTGMLKVLR